jgi:hypothetical protein
MRRAALPPSGLAAFGIREPILAMIPGAVVLLFIMRVVKGFAEPQSPSLRFKSNAALIKARCVKAWGKLPRCSARGPSSSAYSPR